MLTTPLLSWGAYLQYVLCYLVAYYGWLVFRFYKRECHDLVKGRKKEPSIALEIPFPSEALKVPKEPIRSPKDAYPPEEETSD